MGATFHRRRRGAGADSAGAEGTSVELTQVDLFARRVTSMRERVSKLFRKAQACSAQDVLPQAFEELQVALEELQQAEEALRAQGQQQLTSHEALDTERRYYCDLFEQAPVGYLITSTEGTIRQANRPAASLLGTQARQLIGRSLALFVPEGSRRVFRGRIPSLCQAQGTHEWYTQLQPWEGEPLDVLLLVTASFDSTGRPSGLRWLVHQLAQPLEQGAEGTATTQELEQRVAQLTGQLGDLRAQIQSLARYADETAPLQERAVGS